LSIAEFEEVKETNKLPDSSARYAGSVTPVTDHSGNAGDIPALPFCVTGAGKRPGKGNLNDGKRDCFNRGWLVSSGGRQRSGAEKWLTAVPGDESITRTVPG